MTRLIGALGTRLLGLAGVIRDWLDPEDLHDPWGDDDEGTT